MRSTQPVADGRGLESSGGQLLAENLGYALMRHPMRTNYLYLLKYYTCFMVPGIIVSSFEIFETNGRGI